jgi:nicotinamidase-related amidase|tara:strand:+ start:21 stop:608 length:588 start_codon:yes stop_codon:yes gene_type:complete
MARALSMTGSNFCLADSLDSLVVVMDVQQKLTSVMPIEVKESVVEKINILLTIANTLFIPIIVTEQYPDGLGPTVPALNEQLTRSVAVIEKTSFSAFDALNFAEHIKQSGRKQIVLVGMEAHICILQTALALQKEGFRVFVVEDAVCSRSKTNQDNGLQRLRKAGVIVTNVESVFFEWLGDASKAEFKDLVKLIV